jgi:FAD/FMN-containing dehydrogenase/Fe-S oxidoreductase
METTRKTTTARALGVRQTWTGATPRPAFARAEALEADLRGEVRGEVRFDAGSRAVYATDASNYRQVPIGVVLPHDAADVIQTLTVCQKYGAPVLLRGGGTSLAGQCCNVAVVLDCSQHMNGIRKIDAERRLAYVQPGVVLDDLRDAAERHGLTFGPDPATHNRCTLGGMLGNDSCGVHSVLAGKTVDNTEAMDVVTYDGLRLHVGATSEDELERIIVEGGPRGALYAGMRALRDEYADLIRARFPRIPRRVSGYNLDQLLPENGFHVARALVGTEGTCVTILEAMVRLIESRPARTLLVLGYADIATACEDIPLILTHQPIGLEGMDGRLIADMRTMGLHRSDVARLPAGDGWLLVEFGEATAEAAEERARGLVRALERQNAAPAMKLVTGRELHSMWVVRESAMGATALVPGRRQSWPGWEDSAVAPERLPAYLRDLRDLMERFEYTGAFYGHFGQGCVHVRIDFDLATPEGIARFERFTAEAADLVVGYGGSLSGEHGDGQAHADLLAKMFGPELVEAFAKFKALWDPAGKMNPGKIVQPYGRATNLRLGASYAPAPLQTHFSFREDQGSVANATLRCVGVGKCRRHDGGTMCPSYMVTREEKHSTRGRARLLFEMLQGEVLTDRWRNEAVKDALDLCLACKGCKGDCPVQVDMATYKAEFLAHYYEGRLRPITAYAFGLIHRWARLAASVPSLTPWLANAVTRAPLLGAVAKRAAGIAPERRIPAFAPETFKRQFRRHQRSQPPRNIDAPRVILWPDTFNNHFHPETALAAVEVLEAAGFQVVVPQQPLCCGRPLYDYGMLDTAKGLLRRILATLKPEIEAGTPVVGLEPSCVAVFRDELPNLFPDDADALRLSRQTFLLSEFLNREARGYMPPKLARQALLHGHCHHKALMKLTDAEELLTKMGMDFTAPDTGCCGMAGAFGFERGDHYAISLAVGERVLLPAVRAAARETLIVADGFSCREQIAQTTDRGALHLAQVLHMAHLAQREGASGLQGQYPEAQYAERYRPRSPAPVRQAALLGVFALAASSVVSLPLLWRLRGRRGQRHGRIRA